MISQPPQPFWNRILSPENILRLMAVLVFAMYVQTVTFELVYDDFTLITLNPWLQGISGLKDIFTHHSWAFLDGSVPARHYRPMFLLWLWLVQNVAGPAPGWFHLFAIFTHLAACVLVYRIALQLLEGDRNSSAFTALLFATHPSRAETVGWIAAATESLLAVFLLGSFLAYLAARRSPRPIAWSVVSLLCFAGALLTKESALLLPVAIIAYEIFFRRSRPENFTTRKLAYLLGGMAGTIFVFLAVREAVLGGIGDTAMPAPISEIVFTAPLASLLLLRQAVWPVGLSALYPTVVVTHFSWKYVGLPALVLLAVIAVVGYLIRRSPVLKFAAAWFSIFLVPIIVGFNWIQLHDRHLYLPFLGAALMAVVLAREIPWPHTVHPRLASAWLLVCVSLACAGISANEVRTWRSSIALFTRAVEVAPANRDAVELLAESYFSVGKKEESLAVLRKGVANAPTSTRLTFALAHNLYMLERYPEAKSYYEKLLTLPMDPVVTPGAHFELGMVEWKGGDLTLAQQHLDKAVELAPRVEGYQRASARLRALRDKPPLNVQ